MEKQSLAKGYPEKVVAYLQLATCYPDNFGEGKLPGIQGNDIYYWLRLVYGQMNDAENAGEA